MPQRKKKTSDTSATTLPKESITKAALALADEVGIENVSIRKLAAVFNKTPMALYRYFNSIDEIKAAVLQLAYTEVDTSPIPGEPWEETVVRIARSERAMYLRHSRADLHLIEYSGKAVSLKEYSRTVYELHEAQGIPLDILQELWRITSAFLSGFTQGEILEMKRAHQKKPLSRKAWLKTVQGTFSEEAFNDDLAIIIAGIRHLAAPDPCNWHTPWE